MCPCGYDKECPIWCGNGHTNGLCPEFGTDHLLDKLAEQHHTLRLEFNHSDMTWYAYFAGKNGRSLFDFDSDWNFSGQTPQEALTKLYNRNKV